MSRPNHDTGGFRGRDIRRSLENMNTTIHTTHGPGPVNNAETTVIRTRGLTRHFGTGDRRVRALGGDTGVDLTVTRGEIVALLGPNGAGKSTLIDLVLGFTTPTAGTVEVFGSTPRAAIDAQRIGAVMQSGGLLPDLTVDMTLRTIAAAFPAPRDIDEVLDLADLTALRDRRVGKCSGGEQQRIRFALALLGSPDLLILDEPTAGMDAASRHRFWDTMADRAEEGVTVVFATHYLEEAQNFARRIVMLDHGDIIADGTPEELGDNGRILTYSRDGATCTATAEDAAASDALARELLADPAVSDLRISAHTVEDAFLALTGDTAHTGKDLS
jgi:ABC-2 type transport system ATP-binding protein